MRTIFFLTMTSLAFLLGFSWEAQAIGMAVDPMPMSVAAKPVSARPSATFNETKGVDDFVRAYRGRKKPKMAVLLNRRLSAEVDLWQSQVWNLGVKNKFGSKRTGEDISKMGDDWKWRYEDAFLQPFLDHGVRLIDRSTIVRLVSARASQKGRQDEDFPDMPAGVTQENFEIYKNILQSSRSASQQQAAMNTLLNYMKVETDALVNYADYYIELLVSKAPKVPGGYVFKANVIEVKTGVIVASVNSMKWSGGIVADSRPRYRATETGYERIVENKIISPEQIAHRLAFDVMRAIASYWGKG